jgi:hypothetical protein
LILAIGAGAGSGCFFVRRFRLGMPGMIAGIKGTWRARKFPLAAVFPLFREFVNRIQGLKTPQAQNPEDKAERIQKPSDPGAELSYVQLL